MVEVLVVVNVCVEKINVLEIVIIVFKVGDEGKLFGFIGICDIVDVVIVVGVEVVKSEVCLLNGVLCIIGEYEVSFQVYSEVFVKVIVNVVVE